MRDRRPSSMRTEPDRVLVEAARRGDQQAKEHLFRRHVVMANQTARRLVGSGADQDDLVQDAFVQAFSGLHKLREPDAFGMWLRGIIVRLASKVHRKHRLLNRLGLRDEATFDLEHAASPQTPPEVRVELRELSRALRQMPAAVRVAVILRRIEGRKLQEIADLTEVSRTTVKRRLERGARILERLGEQGTGS